MPIPVPVVSELSTQFTQNPTPNDASLKNLTNRMQTERRSANIERCIALLEHVGSCWDTRSCKEGEGCVRTKQVLYHYRTCRTTQEGQECSICKQLIVLCNMHAQRCQSYELGCDVLRCHNEKKPLPHSKNSPSSEECRELVRKLMKAFRLPSKEEKLQKIHQLFISNPHTTVKVLRELKKLKNKKSKVGLDQTVPIQQPASRQTLTVHGEMIPAEVNKLTNALNQLSTGSHIAWKAKVTFKHVRG